MPSFELWASADMRLTRWSQVHCVKAASQLLKLVQREGPFPAGLILHSFLGPADLIRPFAAVDGVHFSISGHSLRSPKRAPALVSQVWPAFRACNCCSQRVEVCACRSRQTGCCWRQTAQTHNPAGLLI